MTDELNQTTPSMCAQCAGTGRVTIRVTYPMSYVCAGEPPEDARGVAGVTCDHCYGSGETHNDR